MLDSLLLISDIVLLDVKVWRFAKSSPWEVSWLRSNSDKCVLESKSDK